MKDMISPQNGMLRQSIQERLQHPLAVVDDVEVFGCFAGRGGVVRYD